MKKLHYYSKISNTIAYSCLFTASTIYVFRTEIQVYVKKNMGKAFLPPPSQSLVFKIFGFAPVNFLHQNECYEHEYHAIQE